ncbi:MAG: fructosamine kinase family protein [Prolixibacteraceae bacterium]|nr:fructosamine kinase family protein [Prolixibacteraceae bacterium]
MTNKQLIIHEAERELTRYFGTDVVVSSSVTVGGGCINNASKLETNAGTFFFKWNYDGPGDMFIRESEGLKELKRAAAGHLVIPDVIAAKEIDKVPGFLILEFLNKSSNHKDFYEKLGRGLAMVHRYSSEKYGFYSDNYCGSTPQKNTRSTDWAQFFRDNRIGYLLDLIRMNRPLPAGELNIYEKLLIKIPEILPETSFPVLIHGDLWSGNYMITDQGPAILDPAAYYADREMEMGIMTLFGGFPAKFWEAYNEVNPLSPDWRDRNGLYQLYHVLNHYYLFGGSYRDQALQLALRYI